MLTLLGDDPKQAAAEAAAVLELETRLAKASKSNVDLRDPIENYHLMTLDKLQDETPGLSWKSYLDGLGLAGVEGSGPWTAGLLQGGRPHDRPHPSPLRIGAGRRISAGVC